MEKVANASLKIWVAVEKMAIGFAPMNLDFAQNVAIGLKKHHLNFHPFQKVIQCQGHRVQEASAARRLTVGKLCVGRRRAPGAPRPGPGDAIPTSRRALYNIVAFSAV